MANYECRGKKKLWSVRFNVMDNNGKSHTKRLSGFKFKREAEAAYLRFLDEYNLNGVNFSPEDSQVYNKKLKEIIPEFLEYKKQSVKEASFYEILSIFNKFILTPFGDIRIKNITKPMILQWQHSLNQYSYKYKVKIRASLYSFYKYLNTYYDIDNIVARVETFSVPKVKKEMQFWTLEEFNMFIDCVDNNTYKTFFSFLYYTGCRLGEALALNYKDIDFKNKTLKITKSISTKIVNRDLGNTFNITSPKNYSSNRSIFMPQKLIDVLLEYFTKNPETTKQSFIFGGYKPLPETTIRRYLNNYINSAGIKPIRIHDFRHSHASLLISQGSDIVLVAKRLGHSNTEQTLNTYAHLFPSTEYRLVDKLNEIL